MMNVIEIKDLKFGYSSKRKILNGLNITVKEGEYITWQWQEYTCKIINWPFRKK